LNDLQTLLLSCISPEPEARPLSKDLVVRLESIIGELNDLKVTKDVANLIRNRISISNTLHVFGKTKRHMRDSKRMKFLLDHLEEDIQAAWTVDQRKFILEGLRTGTYCQNVPLQSLQPSGLDEHSTNCVYLWRNKKDKKGYVGVVSTSSKRNRKNRDKEHLRGKSPFDKELQKSANLHEEWEVITLCTYGNPSSTKAAANWEREGRWENLNILAFNTWREAHGWNTIAGGSIFNSKNQSDTF
jgi:hypothetical protein